MKSNQYYPQIKWRAAEWEALETLPVNILEGITPIISMPDIDWNYDREEYKKSLSEHLKNFGENLSNSWKLETPVFLDLQHLDKHSDENYHPLDTCFSQAREQGKNLIPVYSINYSESYLNSICRNIYNGTAIRLNNLQEDEINKALSLITSKTSLPSTSIDVIIDLGDISKASADLVSKVITSCNQISSIASWRNIILSSTCYPTSQAGIPKEIIHLHKRLEWDLWKQVISSNDIHQPPCFSDYPSSSSKTTSVNPRFMSQSVSIRYSNERHWIFVKGSQAKGNGWGQTQKLCKLLVDSEHYFNREFSWGDDQIFKRSEGEISSGGSKDWRKVAHSHHLTLVVKQLFNYSSMLAD